MEAKNAVPKSKKMFNFKNIPFSVIEFLQTNMSHALWNSDGSPKTGHATTKLPSIAGVPYTLTQSFCSAELSQCGIEKTALAMPNGPC